MDISRASYLNNTCEEEMHSSFNMYIYTLTLPFQHKDVVTNLSSYKLTPEELDILTFGLSYGIPPNKLNRTDIFTTFDMMIRVYTQAYL